MGEMTAEELARNLADPECGVIYRILVNGGRRIYVGSTRRGARQRWTEHQWYLRRGIHPNQRLQRCWDRHGPAALVFEVIETGIDLNLILAREQAHIWRIPAGKLLNARPVTSTNEAAWAASRGRIMSPEERARRSEAAKRSIADGRSKRGPWSAERRASHSVALAGRKMPPVSDATRQNISAALRGRKRCPEAQARSMATRHASLMQALPTWQALREAGASLREIERKTGNARSVIARELKAAGVP